MKTGWSGQKSRHNVLRCRAPNTDPRGEDSDLLQGEEACNRRGPAGRTQRGGKETCAGYKRAPEKKWRNETADVAGERRRHRVAAAGFRTRGEAWPPVPQQGSGPRPGPHTSHPALNTQVPALEKIHACPGTDSPVSTAPCCMLFLRLRFDSFTIHTHPVLRFCD